MILLRMRIVSAMVFPVVFPVWRSGQNPNLNPRTCKVSFYFPFTYVVSKHAHWAGRPSACPGLRPVPVGIIINKTRIMLTTLLNKTCDKSLGIKAFPLQP